MLRYHLLVKNSAGKLQVSRGRLQTPFSLRAYPHASRRVDMLAAGGNTIPSFNSRFYRPPANYSLRIPNSPLTFPLPAAENNFTRKALYRKIRSVSKHRGGRKQRAATVFSTFKSSGCRIRQMKTGDKSVNVRRHCKGRKILLRVRAIIIIRERDNSFSSASVFLRKLTENIICRKAGYEFQV